MSNEEIVYKGRKWVPIEAVESLRAERDALHAEIADGGPKGRNYTNAQFQQVLRERDEWEKEANRQYEFAVESMEHESRQELIFNAELRQANAALLEGLRDAEKALSTVRELLRGDFNEKYDEIVEAIMSPLQEIKSCVSQYDTAQPTASCRCDGSGYIDHGDGQNGGLEPCGCQGEDRANDPPTT